MDILKDKIRSEGIVLSEHVLKVDAFLNHQIDPQLMQQVGHAFATRFRDSCSVKIGICETPGSVPAGMVVLELVVTAVFARKTSLYLFSAKSTKNSPTDASPALGVLTLETGA